MKRNKTIMRRAALLLCCVTLLSASGCGPRPSTGSLAGGGSCGNDKGSGDQMLLHIDGFVTPLKEIEGLTQLTYAPGTDSPLDIPHGDKYIALTFDDGPTGGMDGRTAHLLDGLKERNAHATFFICGYRIKDFHQVIQRYLPEGHEVGNHTMDHIRLDRQPDGGKEQVRSNTELIKSYLGEEPTVMRPVGGAHNAATRAAMKELGLPIILWDLDTLDWKIRDAQSVKNNILSSARDGSIVLMHDLYSTTIDGVLEAMDVLKEQGYAFVTVSELAQIKGVTLEPGVVYNDMVSEAAQKIRPKSPPPRNPDTYQKPIAA